jgi:hypothetical protein
MHVTIIFLDVAETPKLHITQITQIPNPNKQIILYTMHVTMIFCNVAETQN